MTFRQKEMIPDQSNEEQEVLNTQINPKRNLTVKYNNNFVGLTNIRRVKCHNKISEDRRMERMHSKVNMLINFRFDKLSVYIVLIPKRIEIDYIKSKLVKLQGEESVQKYPKGGRKREKRKNRTA